MVDILQAFAHCKFWLKQNKKSFFVKDPQNCRQFFVTKLDYQENVIVKIIYSAGITAVNQW